MTEYPNPQHYVRWETTPELYNFICYQLASFPTANGFLSQLVDKWDTLWRGPEPLERIAFKLVHLARDLYNSERYSQSLPAYADYLPGTLEGARYRDDLLDLHQKVQWPTVTLAFLQGVILRCYSAYLANLPGAAFIESDSYLAEIPLIDTIDVKKVTAEILRNLFQEEMEKYRILESVRTQIADNMHTISAKPDCVTTPQQFKGTSAELIHAVFKHTPFESIFDVSIPVFLPQETRFSGHWIIAPPGRGKTTLLHSMFLEDLHAHASIVIMDSKGELAGPIKQLKAVQDRLVLIEPNADFPLALNPFNIPGANVAQTRELLQYIFAGLMGLKFTELQRALFRNVLPAVIKLPNPTLDTFKTIIVNGFPQEQFSLLDARQQGFFTDKQNGFYSDTYRGTRREIVWRIDDLMSNDLLRTMFDAPTTKLDIGRLMDEGRIIVIDNSKRLLGKEGCEFFGRFFLSLILAAAHQRGNRTSDQKLPSYVYIDECHDIIAEDQSIPEIIDQCRSQKIAVILAHQRSDQLSAEVLNAVANCAIRFANSDDEARFLADKLRTTPEFLRSLPRGTFAAFVRDMTPAAVALKIPFNDLSKLTRQTTSEQQTLRTAMRSRYSYVPPQPQSHLAPPVRSGPAELPPKTALPTEVPRQENSSTGSTLSKRPQKPLPSRETPDPGEPSSDWNP
jgi:hypothetical protein